MIPTQEFNIYTLFDGFTDNMHRYFMSCILCEQWVKCLRVYVFVKDSKSYRAQNLSEANNEAFTNTCFFYSITENYFPRNTGKHARTVTWCHCNMTGSRGNFVTHSPPPPPFTDKNSTLFVNINSWQSLSKSQVPQSYTHPCLKGSGQSIGIRILLAWLVLHCVLVTLQCQAPSCQSGILVLHSVQPSYSMVIWLDGKLLAIEVKLQGLYDPNDCKAFLHYCSINLLSW